MRKYRGKTKEGKWVEGWYIEYNSLSYILPTRMTKSFINSFVEVIPSTVGKETGLKDKNGKKIYEGDIVCYQIPEKSSDKKLNLNKSITKEKVVEWSNFSCGYNLTKTDKPIYEVIGNIHE